MTGEIFVLIASLLLSAATITFVYKGRNKGYSALAARTTELRSKGVTSVWILYGDKGVGYQRIGLKYTSLWTLLNTGFITYRANQQLIIEFPWWGKMRQLLAVPYSQLSISNSSVIFNRKRHSAVRIGDQAYVVAGINIDDSQILKKRLKLRDTNETSALLEQFITALTESPVTDLGEESLLHTGSVEKPRSISASRAIKGTILYIFLPCLIITAILVAWSVITKQPAFR